MGSATGLVLHLALQSLLLGLASGQAELARTGKTFGLSLHAASLPAELANRLADEALTALEALRPTLDKWQIKVARPPMLHLHLEPKTFRAVEIGMSGLPFLVEDCCARDGAEGHVLVGPTLPVESLQVLGLPPATAARLQKCAGECVARQLADTAQKDPWLGEVFAFGLLDATNNPSGKFGVDPWFDDRRGSHARVAGAGSVVLFAGIVDDVRLLDSKDARRLREEYASVAAQFGATSGTAWARKLLARQSKPLGPIPTRQALFETMLGKEEAKVEARFQNMVTRWEPVWGISRGCGVRGSAWLLAGAKDEAAQVVAAAPPPAGPYRIRCQVTLLGGPVPEFRFVLLPTGSDQDPFCVSLVEGQVGVHRWDSKVRKYRRLMDKTYDVACGRKVDLRVDVDKGVKLSIDGAEVMAVAITEDLHGDWGVATNVAVVQVEGLAIESLAPPRKK